MKHLIAITAILSLGAFAIPTFVDNTPADALACGGDHEKPKPDKPSSDNEEKPKPKPSNPA